MAAVAHACVLNKPFAVFNSSLFSLENSNINQEKKVEDEHSVIAFFSAV